MKKNVFRLIMFCAAILGFMLVAHNIGFARSHNTNFVAAHYVPGEEKPIIAAAFKAQAMSSWEATFAWVILSSIMLGSLLFIVWVVFASKKPMLPSVPQVTKAARKQTALFKNEDRMMSSLPEAS